ncbi:hypothetical protein D3C76_827500 [compost metagenome]
MSPWYTGRRVWVVLRSWPMMVSSSSSRSMPWISVRGTIRSFTVTFSRSRMLSSMPCRLALSCSLDSLTTLRSSSLFSGLRLP